jgi:Protein of unknown function (DUF1565)
VNRLRDLRALLCVLAIGLAFGMAGCAPPVEDVSVRPYGSSSASSTAAPICTGTPSTTLVYVGPSGSDNNCGTSATPYATIGTALTAATGANAVIMVTAGTYSAASGETFPISVPANVTLQGVGTPTITGVGRPASGPAFQLVDPAQGGTAYSEAVLVAGQGATITGLNIVGTGPTTSGDQTDMILIAYPVTGVTVSNNTLSGPSSIGILEASAGSNTYSGNIINTGTNAGFFSSCNSLLTVSTACPPGLTTGDIFENNTFNSTNSGVDLASTSTTTPATYDFGGGTTGSTGGNIFCGYTASVGRGMYIGLSDGQVWADANTWVLASGNAPVTSIATAAHVDIDNQNGTSTLNPITTASTVTSCP